MELLVRCLFFSHVCAFTPQFLEAQHITPFPICSSQRYHSVLHIMICGIYYTFPFQLSYGQTVFEAQSHGSEFEFTSMIDCSKIHFQKTFAEQIEQRKSVTVHSTDTQTCSQNFMFIYSKQYNLAFEWSIHIIFL